MMKILIVEDEPGISAFLRQGLEEESFEVDVAETGAEGLTLALSGEYDLLLLDWMLPGVSGVELCRVFRRSFRDIPVIFLTAKDTAEEAIFALQSGANDYIRKPFHFEELLERIRVQLRPKINDQSDLTLGPITLNRDTFEVYKHGVPVSLTQKEFALLEFLMRNKGRVCRRSSIIAQVWDIHFEYNTGVIDVYINALRKKLALTDAENYIQTVRGVGYLAKE
jgi:two-component system, OmpR family, copper resistance phosphate regulon response regulator CusR